MDKIRLLLLFLWLSELSVSDIRYRKVPVWMMLAGGIIATAAGIYECVSGNGSIRDMLSGMIPGMILLLLALGTRNAGWADGMIVMFTGSVLGFRQCLLTVMFSLIMISVLSAALLALKKADKDTMIPYVPFLEMGLVVCKLIGS